MLTNSCSICGVDASATTISEHLASQHSVLLAHALLTPEVTDSNVAWIRKCMSEVEGFSFICKSEDFTDGSRASLDDDSSSTASETADRKPAHNKGRKAVYKDTVFLVNKQKYVRCLVCNSQLHWTQRRVHIYTTHLGVPNLFHCPYCPYASTSNRCPVDTHVRKRHDAKGSAVVRLGEFEPQIIAWLGKCFRLDGAAVAPPMKKPSASTSTSGDSSASAGAIAASAREPGVARPPAKAHASTSSSSTTPTTTKTPTVTPQKTVKAKVITPKDSGPRVVCQICKMKVLASGTGRHVLQDHLKLPHLYKCPECEFGSSTYDTVVIEHAKFKHNIDHIISFAEQYAQQISTMTTFCFPS
uniref:C2H2-type domain-containing protein n=1 Tax=Plectus sambesii TaxID=2011161 RepID=A0A914W0N9_9BILA